MALFSGFAAGGTLFDHLCRSIAGLVAKAQSQVTTDHVQGLLHAQSIALNLGF